MATDPIESEDPSVLRAEIARLRTLVGPAEQSYRDLQTDLLAARDQARGAEAAAGTQRARAVQLAVQVQRHNQLKQRVRSAVSPALNGLRRVNRSFRALR